MLGKKHAMDCGVEHALAVLHTFSKMSFEILLCHHRCFIQRILCLIFLMKSWKMNREVDGAVVTEGGWRWANDLVPPAPRKDNTSMQQFKQKNSIHLLQTKRSQFEEMVS